MIISGLIKHFGFLMFSGGSQGDIWKKWITLWNEIKYCLGFVNSKVIYVNIYWYQVSACNIINKETLAQVLSCECCEIFKNMFSTEHPWMAASTIFQVLTHVLSLDHDFENTSEIDYLKIILCGRIFVLFSQFIFSISTCFRVFIM